MKGKKARIIGFAILSLILIIFVFYKLFINQIILSVVNNYFHKNLGSSISAVSSDFSIFSLRFSMTQPVVCALGKDPGHAFLKAEAMAIQVTPDLILGKKIHFGHILFFKPRVLVEILKDGSNNLPILKQTPGTPAIPEFIVQQLSFKEMKFSFRDETKGLAILSPLLNVEMRSNGNSDHQLSIESSGMGELFFNGRGRAINKLQIKGMLSPQRLFIAESLIQIEKSNLAISGILKNWLDAQLDLQMKGNVFPEEFTDLLPPGNGNQELARLGPWRFGLQLFQDKNLVEIKEIHVSVLAGEILGHAVFPRRAGKKTDHLSLAWKDLDFSLMKGILPINLFSYGSGNADASFSDFKLSEIKGSLNARFKAKVPGPHDQEGVPLAGDLKLSFLQGTILVDTVSLQSQGNRINGKLNIEKNRVAGSINGKIDHLRGILLFLSPFNDSLRLLAEKKIDGEMVISGILSGTIAKPVLHVDFTQGKIKNLTRSPLDFGGSLFLKNQVLQLENIRIGQTWGMMILDGTIPIGPASKGMDLQVQANRLDLAQLCKELPFAVPSMQGILDFQVRLTQKTGAPFKFNPSLAGDFSFTNFYFKQMQLGNIQGKLSSTKESILFLFQIPSYNSEISAELDLHNQLQTKIVFLIRNGPLKEFLKLLPIPAQEGFSGTITSQAQVTFLPSKFMESLQITFAASDLLLAAGKQNIRNKNPLRLAYQSGGLIIESFSLLMDNTEINASGELPSKPRAGKEISISAKGGGNFLSVFLPDLFFEGNLDAKISIRGSLVDPLFSGSVQVEQGRLLLNSQSLPLTDMQLNLELKENLLILHSLQFNIKEGEVSGKGTLPLPFLKTAMQNLSAPQMDKAYAADLTISHCAVADLETFLSGKFPENTTGDISGDIHLKGKNPDFSDLLCTATLSVDDLNINGFPFSLAGPIKISSDEKGIILQEVVLKGQEDLQLVMKGFYDRQKEKPLNFSIKGKLDSQVLLGFFPELAASGNMAIELHIGGTIKDIEWNGKIEVMNNTLQFAALNLFMNQLNCLVSINKRNIDVERWTGNLNGGTIEAKGLIGLENTKQPSVTLQLQMAGINLNFPKGLFTSLSGQLNLLSADKTYLLKGNIDINGGRYNEPFNVGSYLYEFLFTRKQTIIESENTDFKKQFKFNIDLKTPQALVVENNVCRSELNAELTLGGSYFQPHLAGRIYVKEGGNIFFGNRIFSIDRGQINFINPSFIEPDFNIASSTQIGMYAIKLTLSGTPQTFVASFSSVPPLSEQSIVSMLVTGETPDTLSGPILYETGNTAMNYISYGVTGKLGELIKNNLNLQSFRIDGSLLSSKEDPGARITIGKNITPKLELTYSQGLRQTQNPTWMLNYKPLKSLNFQGIQSNTDLYTLGVQYQLSFHSRKQAVQNADTKAKKSKPLLIEKIQISGDPVLALPVILKQIKQKPGKSFSFIRFQEDSERIRGLYRKNDYLSAKISADYYPGAGKVTLIYRISADSKVFLSFLPEGITRSLRNKCISRWMDGQFDAQRISNVTSELTQYFFLKKYYHVKVTSNRIEKDHELFYIFSIKKGMMFKHIEYDFTGNRQVTDKEILRELKNRRLDALLFLDPGEVRKKLENYYKNKGFLHAKVSLPKVTLNNLKETVVIRFSIIEDVLFRINKISFSGNSMASAPELLKLTKLKKNMPISKLEENNPIEKIEEYYRKRGFNQVQVSAKSALTAAKDRVDSEFTISEGSQGIINGIKIVGNNETRESVIIRALTFKVGDKVDFIEINKSRKNLYDLGIFDLVDFELLPADGVPQPSADLKEIRDGEPRKYFQVQIKVKESPDYYLKVGGQYDTDSQIAARFELENRNLLGRGHSLGVGFQLNSKETDLRGYYRLPNLLFKKIDTIFTAFLNKREESLFSNYRQGFTIQQQVKLWKTSIFSWNYTREKTKIVTYLDPGAAGQKANVAHVTFGYYNDKRDNIFNPAKGFLISGSIQDAARLLGSDYSFIRYSGQFDFYLRATPHLTWASSLNFGLVDELGQTLSLVEKFFASGRSTIRGFTSDEVGPKEEISGKAIGGDAILIFRQELRWQIFPLISVVGFTDWGNIFAKIADYNILKLRKSAGIGIRLHLQPLLFRFDWGIKLDRRPGESPSLFYFGIGHIF